MICPNCGSTDNLEKDGFRVCKYCNTKLEKIEISSNSKIAINSDVERLLKKCKEDPLHARRYAGIILDIDPTNKEVKNIYKWRYIWV